jgi:type VI secretion system protein VasG
MLPDISREFLRRTLSGVTVERVEVSVAESGFGYRFDAVAG